MKMKKPCACVTPGNCHEGRRTGLSENFYCCQQGMLAGGAKPLTRAEMSEAVAEALKPSPEQILDAMAETFRERGKIYGDNWKRIGAVLHALAGGKPVTISTPEEWLRWSLHMMIVTKITRLATTDLNHIDSSHDAAVYAAMLEAVQQEQQNG